MRIYPGGGVGIVAMSSATTYDHDSVAEGGRRGAFTA